MNGRRKKMPRAKPVIGWREWVALPEFGVSGVKAKIDTGARSSALHAHRLEIAARDDRELARFEIHPMQRSSEGTVHVESEVIEWRDITSSAGHRERRPVILTPVALSGLSWNIELTLTNRDAMGFRMLLGRQAVRRRFLVDPGRSFLAKDTPDE